MTEYELHFRISEHLRHITSTYQGWFGASSAVLLVSHYLAGMLSATLRKIIAVAYLFYSLNCYLGLIKFYYAVDTYTDQIEQRGGLPYPIVPYLDISNGFLVIYLLLGGTGVVAWYFWKSTRAQAAQGAPSE